MNLKGDAGKPAAKPVVESPRIQSSEGGAMKTILVLLFVVVILGGAAFFLNKAGIIKLWGKKPVQQAVVQQIEFADSSEVLAQADTAGMVQFSGKGGAKTQQAPAKAKQEKQQPASKKNASVPPPAKLAMAAPSKQSAPASEKQKAPAPKQQPAANAALGTGPYSIQLSSWASREKAEMEVEALKQKGHPAFMQEGFVSGLGHRHRVNVGRFSSEAAAQEFAKKLVGQVSGGYLIVQIGN
jgi:cell division septation protein DedD